MRGRFLGYLPPPNRLDSDRRNVVGMYNFVTPLQGGARNPA
jgi:hypothetical protein